MKVFISYPRERETEASRLGVQLRAELRAQLNDDSEVYVCHDAEKEDFRNKARGQQQPHLADKLEESEVVVALWDRNYGRAAWCTWELQHALELGKRIVICQMDETGVPPVLHQAKRGNAEVVGELAATLRESTALESRRTKRPPDLFPAASLFEATAGPRFDAPIRAAGELLVLVAMLFGTIVIEYALYRVLAKPWLTTETRTHLASLLTGINVAMTLIGGLTVSFRAALVTGVTSQIVGLVAMAGWIVFVNEPTQPSITTAAVAQGVLHGGLLLLSREHLLGEKWKLRRPSLPKRRTLLGHVAAAVGVSVVAVLLLTGIGFLDFAMSFTKRRHEGVTDLMLLYRLPVLLGGLVGALVGIVLAVAVYQRVLNNYRATAPRRHAWSILWGIVVLSVAVTFGALVGAWIRSNLHEAISALGGGYAGGQVGILLAVGLAVPLALGTSRLTTSQERAWAMIGLAVVVVVVTLRIRSFPFAATRSGVSWDILRGALTGLIPIYVIRAAATPNVRVILVALLVHVVAIGLFLLTHATMPASRISTRNPISVIDSPAPAPFEPAMNENIDLIPIPDEATRVQAPLLADPAPLTDASVPDTALGDVASAIDAASTVEIDAPMMPGPDTDAPNDDAAGSDTGSAGSGSAASDLGSDVGIGSGSGSGSGSDSGSGSNIGSGSGSGSSGSGDSNVEIATIDAGVPPPAPEVLVAVVSASYGANCGVPPNNVTAKVAELCSGRVSCSFTADNGLFGDPKNGCAKDFVAAWTCGDETRTTAPVAVRANEGYSIVMNCTR